MDRRTTRRQLIGGSAASASPWSVVFSAKVRRLGGRSGKRRGIKEIVPGGPLRASIRRSVNTEVVIRSSRSTA